MDRKLERQQSEIETLQGKVAAAEELLNRERRENELRSAEERRAADAERLADQYKFEERHNAAGIQSDRPSLKTTAPSMPEDRSPGTARVQTTTVTSGREQTLYRSAVIAYKTGACEESIKSFDAFTRAYPDSPFKNDAAYYRKDCAERLSTTATR
jgi:TolA-binding protein